MRFHVTFDIYVADDGWQTTEGAVALIEAAIKEAFPDAVTTAIDVEER